MRNESVSDVLCPGLRGKRKAHVVALPVVLVAIVFGLGSPLFSQDTAANFDAIAQQANAARTAHDIPAAIALYKQAVELQPSWPDGWWYLGTLQYGAGDFTSARDTLTRYIELTPKAAPALAVRGLCEFETGEREKSLDDIRTALAEGASDHSTNEGILRYHLALLLTLRGDFEDALREFGFFARSGVADPGNGASRRFCRLLCVGGR